jgi:hypothetical protein
VGTRHAGPGQSKKIEVEEAYQDFLKDLEDDIRAAVGGDSDDLILNHLVELSIASHRERRPLFPHILDEPAFWRRHFHRLVRQVLDEEDALREATNAAMKLLTGIEGLI